MGQHTATVIWKSDGHFTSGRYSRAHELHFDGGTVVRGSASPSVVPVPMSDPAAVDPEEALLASASACHMLWFLAIAHDAELEIVSYRDEAVAAMGRNELGKIAVTRIILHPQIVWAGREPSPGEIEALHHEAHEKCFIANSLRSEVVVASVGTSSSPQP